MTHIERRSLALVLLLFLATRAPVLAARITPPPGAFDPHATAADICRVGYAREHRAVPYRIRDRIYAAYGLPRGSRRGYVIDHLIPLELGGLNVAQNLWPQTRSDAHRKDLDENRLRLAVCSGTLSIDAARAEMLRLW